MKSSNVGCMETHGENYKKNEVIWTKQFQNCNAYPSLTMQMSYRYLIIILKEDVCNWFSLSHFHVERYAFVLWIFSIVAPFFSWSVIVIKYSLICWLRCAMLYTNIPNSASTDHFLSHLINCQTLLMINKETICVWPYHPATHSV